MYKIKVKLQFSSAHRIRGYKGKCETLHGHNWDVEAVAASETLNDIGMVMDFKELKIVLAGILSELDHKNLNEIEYFKQINPTSENISRYIYEKVSKQNPKLNIQEITVWETDSSSAVYS